MADKKSQQQQQSKGKQQILVKPSCFCFKKMCTTNVPSNQPTSVPVFGMSDLSKPSILALRPRSRLGKKHCGLQWPWKQLEELGTNAKNWALEGDNQEEFIVIQEEMEDVGRKNCELHEKLDSTF
jgi:hypothetical protein